MHGSSITADHLSSLSITPQVTDNAICHLGGRLTVVRGEAQLTYYYTYFKVCNTDSLIVHGYKSGAIF